MAGGIDWFRWHHGSITDPKFGLVAKKAGARLGDVIAVWAWLLESASANADQRGVVGPVDFESLDYMLGMDDGSAARILDAMTARGLLGDGGAVTAWAKRQPKREDDTAAERKRRQRERDHEAEMAASVTSAQSRTSEHGPDESRAVTNGHDREEESREEESRNTSVPDGTVSAEPTGKRAKTPEIPCPYAEILAAYHEALPDLPKAKLLSAKRKQAMRKLWAWVLRSEKSDGTRRATSGEEALAWIAGYFRHASHSDFLMGRTPRAAEHAGWQCDFDFLLTDKGMKHVIEKTSEAA